MLRAVALCQVRVDDIMSKVDSGIDQDKSGLGSPGLSSAVDNV